MSCDSRWVDPKPGGHRPRVTQTSTGMDKEDAPLRTTEGSIFTPTYSRSRAYCTHVHTMYLCLKHFETLWHYEQLLMCTLINAILLVVWWNPETGFRDWFYPYFGHLRWQCASGHLWPQIHKDHKGIPTDDELRLRSCECILLHWWHLVTPLNRHAECQVDGCFRYHSIGPLSCMKWSMLWRWRNIMKHRS